MAVYTSGTLDINDNSSKFDIEFLDKAYRQYYKNVYNYISFRINNHTDVEELVSLVFENAVRKFHTYKAEVSPIEAWLIAIARNVVTDYFRIRGRNVFSPLEEIINLISPNKEPEEVVVFNENNKALLQAMTKLKPIERQVLSMKFATDLKNTEIAKILKISDSKVGVMIHRSIKKLRNYLQ